MPYGALPLAQIGSGGSIGLSGCPNIGSGGLPACPIEPSEYPTLALDAL